MNGASRFVGLMMATKTLPKGNISVLLDVYEAIGQDFFRRLLLPIVGEQVGINN